MNRIHFAIFELGREPRLYNEYHTLTQAILRYSGGPEMPERIGRGQDNHLIFRNRLDLWTHREHGARRACTELKPGNGFDPGQGFRYALNPTPVVF